MTGALVALPLALPLLTALVCALLFSDRARVRVAVASATLQTAVAALLLAKVLPEARLGVMLGGWPAPYGIALVIDPLAAIMLCLSAGTLLAAHVYSIGEWRDRTAQTDRLPLLHFLALGVNLSFVTGDLFNLFVAFEMMLVASYALMSLEARGGRDLGFGFGYMLVNVVGGSLFLCSAGFAYGAWGTLNMADLAMRLAAEPPGPRLDLFALMLTLVFALKAGVFPLYHWLPKSYPILPGAVAGFFAAMLTKVGVYALLRLYATVLPPHLSWLHMTLAWLSVATMLFGVLGALSQGTVRGILSYHIVSQVGYMTLCIGLRSPFALAACLIFVAHNILAKGTLFLVGGAARRHLGTDAVTTAKTGGGGLMTVRPLLAAVFLAQAFALAGLPPLSGFWGKYMILQETVAQGRWVFAFAVLLTSLFTLMSMLKIWLAVFWGEPAPLPAGRRVAGVGLMTGVCASLAAVTLAFGLGFPFVLRAAESATALALDRKGYAAFVRTLPHKAEAVRR